jgi:hypothetical protein
VKRNKIIGHVAQHVTLAGDGAVCPRAGHPAQGCEQIMLTRDGGTTYTTTKRTNHGTSGNFNGYGDLGTHVPSLTTAAPSAEGATGGGIFKTIVGCNGCKNPGGALVQPAFLQTWLDDGTTLTVTDNVSITFKGIPAAMTNATVRSSRMSQRAYVGAGSTLN